ncbi:MAG TPA: SPOR domain-containing protein [Thiopseudomonas sp.]|nr:SPOR domain-containing protein [Thiopseudomonas sp.]
MSATENKLKQRIVGALVLIALAVVFIPMLFKQEEPVREVTVQAPAMPAIPEVPQYPVEQVAVPVPVPEPVLEVEDVWDDALIVDEPSALSQVPSAPIESVDGTQSQPAPDKVVEPVKVRPEPVVSDTGIDKNNLPVSWSIQLASLSNQTNAQNLRDSYRKKQYNAYVRSSGDIHRVFIGPLIKRSEAQKLCENLKSRENQDCFVVRYAPETGQ